MHHLRKLRNIKSNNVVTFFLIVMVVLFLWTRKISTGLHDAYEGEISAKILDKNSELLQILPNKKGHYMTEGGGSSRLRELVIHKEDQFFYYHLGVNPWSALRSIFHRTVYGEHAGGSTITQQLVKNLLHNENERTISNKLIEAADAIALELHTSKKDILSMYLSTVYLGKQTEGIEGGAQYYFGKSTSELSDGEIVRLLALLSAPSVELGSAANTERATQLKKRLGVTAIPLFVPIPIIIRELKKDPAMFELATLVDGEHCVHTCTLTIDRALTSKIREIVHDRLLTKQFNSVENAAVAVIQLGKDGAPNTLLALVGTPNPYGGAEGNQINMALSPRPIGSTWKPFIYGKAIERGARPYSIIDDSEYRYEIGTGFAFYPKNYDGVYHGDVTLHYALSNSLNVPAVRALEWAGIDTFSTFMTGALGFIPRQSFDTYQLSVALGGLEMNPLLLANYFTIFPREGTLAPLILGDNKFVDIPMATTFDTPKQIFAATTTELINHMLSDRLMGVEQFGLESNLNLPFKAYAVKTGTSYDYHDSWTVGYTPGVVVVVWIGNGNNKPMDLLTGARGAGKIWNDVMTLLAARGNITPQEFDTRSIVDVATAEGSSFGFRDDDIPHARLIMKESDLVLEPHNQDVLLFQRGMSVPFRSRSVLMWSVDGKFLDEGKEMRWTPVAPGNYTITAHEKGGASTVTLHLHILKE